MAVQMYWLRPTAGGEIAYEEWRDDAACKGSDPRLFELDSPVRQMGGGEEGETHELVARGLKVCSSCPVKSSCLINSTEEDRYWTTRGGQPPEGLFPDASHPTPVRLTTNPLVGGPRRPERCPKGHLNWRARPNGSRRCVDCAREQAKGRPDLRKGRVKKKCKKGHENWGQRQGGQAGRYCIDCKADGQRRRRAKME